MLKRNPDVAELNLPALIFRESSFSLKRFAFSVILAFDPIAVSAQELVVLEEVRIGKGLGVLVPIPILRRVLAVYLKAAHVRATPRSIGINPLTVRALAASAELGYDLCPLFGTG